MSEKFEKLLCDHEFEVELEEAELYGKTRAALVEYVDALEAEVTRLREAARWIPVTERLPEKGKNIEGIYQNKTYGVRLVIIDSIPVHPYVTHWRPLPQPPEDESC